MSTPLRTLVRRTLGSALAFAAGCAIGHIEQHGAPAAPFDAVIVPGCPSMEDGRPSRCQIARALWAAVLWERGWAQRFITSGSDVHTPFVEAEAIAQVMTALGVPADRIWLEGDALHTDENMSYSLRIARSLGAKTVAVASSRGHALWACRMMLDWGQDCRALGLDGKEVERRLHRAGDLSGLRLRASSPWIGIVEREHRAALKTGRRRPPSWMLYPTIALMRARGEPWVPMPPPGDAKTITWAERLAELAAPPAAVASP